LWSIEGRGGKDGKGLIPWKGRLCLLPIVLFTVT
jgi:hypothetical protein